jgi:crotonobetainyl-CoA:carnitine CoA-transferase CaiB-like acyl-CoA transferase
VRPRFTRRRAIALAFTAVAVVLAALWIRALVGFPPDTTPEGAYLRIASSLGRGDARIVFSYQEDAAQHACYTIRDYRKKTSERVAKAYPEPEKTRLIEEYRAHASAADGADVWLDLAARRGFVAQLRRDLSGIVTVERAGERATIVTARGTRYPFRLRNNGMWGLTTFTASLTAEAERASRDLEVVERAAADYERARR